MLAIDQGKRRRPTHHPIWGAGVTVLSPLARIGNWLGSLSHKGIAWFEGEARQAALISELNRLTDHDLRDVGIEHADIDVVAAEAVQRWRQRSLRGGA